MFPVSRAGNLGMDPVESQSLGDPIQQVPGQVNGTLSHEKDRKESARAPQFGEVYKQIQAKYGERPEKPREIKKTLGKDDFLRIMLTQMKNQDPTNPFKPEQMASEIAQFTSVEQLQNLNQHFSQLETQNKSFGQMSMSHLIGKTVTIDRERFPHLEGQSEILNFELPKDSISTQMSVMNELGEVIWEKDLGAEKAGPVSCSWDGIRSNTLPAKTGNYIFRVHAKDEHDRSMQLNPQTQGRVIGMSFEGTEPVFLVGDARRYDRVSLKNIIRIDLEPQGNSATFQKNSPSLPKDPRMGEQQGVDGVVTPGGLISE